LDEALVITRTTGDKETTYRLFDIIAKDPDATLFELSGEQNELRF
jgi:hypothetical protein